MRVFLLKMFYSNLRFTLILGIISVSFFNAVFLPRGVFFAARIVLLQKCIIYMFGRILYWTLITSISLDARFFPRGFFLLQNCIINVYLIVFISKSVFHYF